MLLQRSSSGCLPRADSGSSVSSLSFEVRRPSGSRATVSPAAQTASFAAVPLWEPDVHSGSSSREDPAGRIQPAGLPWQYLLESRAVKRSTTMPNIGFEVDLKAHPLENIAFSERPSPIQQESSDLRSAFYPFAGASRNEQAHGEVLTLWPYQHDAAAPQTLDALSSAKLLEEGRDQAHASLSEQAKRPSYVSERPSYVSEAGTKALNGARASPKKIPTPGNRSPHSSLARPLPSSSHPPLPFDSDFLLGLKQQAGCSLLERPASTLLPAPLGKRQWRSHSNKDSTGDIACRIAQQASSCRTQRDSSFASPPVSPRPRSFKGLSSFLHGSQGRDSDVCTGYPSSSQDVAGVLESMLSGGTNSQRSSAGTERG